MGAKKERGFHLRVQVPRGPRLGLNYDLLKINNNNKKIIINIRACENQNKQTKNEPTNNNKEQQQFKKRRPYKCNRCLKKVYVKT